MKIKLWGVRGSLPAPLTAAELKKHCLNLLERYEISKSKSKMNPKEFIASLTAQEVGGYGGHTACVEVSTPQSRIIIDGGSGLRPLGDEILRSEHRNRGVAYHILMTHFHWDHLIGLPFFAPVFIPGNEIHFYAVQADLEENIRRIFCKPNFPLGFEKLPAKIFFHALEPRKPKLFTDLTVTPYQLDHPDECWGYRIEHAGKAFAYCVDTECQRVSREQMGLDLPLYQNVDLMVFDAQYSFLEHTERVDWGHSSGPIGIDIALREKVREVLFVHHDPAATIHTILDAEKQTRDYYEATMKNALKKGSDAIHSLRWEFAPEGIEKNL